MFISRLTNRLASSLATRLYGIGFLSIAAVITLVVASIYFADVTKKAAQGLFDRGFMGTLNATRIELLIERHRRLVESTPSEVNREYLARDKQELSAIQEQLERLLERLVEDQKLPRVSPEGPNS